MLSCKWSFYITLFFSVSGTVVEEEADCKSWRSGSTAVLPWGSNILTASLVIVTGSSRLAFHMDSNWGVIGSFWINHFKDAVPGRSPVLWQMAHPYKSNINWVQWIMKKKQTKSQKRTGSLKGVEIGSGGRQELRGGNIIKIHNMYEILKELIQVFK